MTSANLSAGSRPLQAAVVIERTYRAPVEELWALWTTKAGFESWWGPEGCHVEVHVLEAREGGAFEYDMITDAPQAIAAVTGLGLPTVSRTRGWFSEFRPYERLTLVHLIGFVPGVEPYEQVIEVDFRQAGGQATMTVTVHPHHDPQWTAMALAGFNSQLATLDRRFG